MKSNYLNKLEGMVKNIEDIKPTAKTEETRHKYEEIQKKLTLLVRTSLLNGSLIDIGAADVDNGGLQAKLELPSAQRDPRRSREADHYVDHSMG